MAKSSYDTNNLKSNLIHQNSLKSIDEYKTTAIENSPPLTAETLKRHNEMYNRTRTFSVASSLSTTTASDDPLAQVEITLHKMTQIENTKLKAENEKLKAENKRLKQIIAKLTNGSLSENQLQSKIDIDDDQSLPMSHINQMGSEYGVSNDIVIKNPQQNQSPISDQNKEITDTIPVSEEAEDETKEEEDFPSILDKDLNDIFNLTGNAINGSSPNSRSMARRSSSVYSNLIGIDGGSILNDHNDNDGSVASELGPIDSIINKSPINPNSGRNRANSESLSLGVTMLQTDEV